MKNGKLRVALVGVSFGAEFIPIYLKHPDVDSLVLVDTNEKLLNTAVFYCLFLHTYFPIGWVAT